MTGLIFKGYQKNITAETLLLDQKSDYHISGYIFSSIDSIYLVVIADQCHVKLTLRNNVFRAASISPGQSQIAGLTSVVLFYMPKRNAAVKPSRKINMLRFRLVYDIDY